MATSAEIALQQEIQSLRARIAELELERQIPTEIIEKSPVMISIVRAPDFIYELVNPAFQTLAPGKEFVGRRFADVWAEVSDPLVEILQNVMRTGRTFNLEDAPYTIQRGLGAPPGTVYVTYSWIPLPGPDGKPDRVLTLAHETTGSVRQRQELAQSNELLRAAKERYQQVLASIAEGYYALDNEWCFAEMNGIAARHFERPATELLGRNIWALTGAQTGSLTYDKFHEAVAARRPIRFEAQHGLTPGHWAELHLYPRDTGLDVYFHDITERNRAQAERDRLFDYSLDILCIAGFDGYFKRVSPSFEKVLGWKEEEALSKPWFEFVHPDDRKSSVEIEKAQQAGSEAFRFDNRYLCRDGSYRWISWNSHLLIDERLIIGVGRDVTDLKRAEEAVRHSIDQFRTLANAIPQLCWMANEDGWIFWYNQRWYDYTGTTPEQMEGWGWQSVHDPKELPNVLERWKASLASGEPFDMAFPLRGADGVFRPFLTRVMPVKDAAGKVVRWFGTNTDISEQRRTEEALRESEARERARAAELGAILDAAPVALFVTQDPECRQMIGSRMTYDMLRLSPGSNVSKSSPEAQRPMKFRAVKDGREIPPEDLPAQKAASAGWPVRNYEFDVVFEDGTCRNMLGDAVPLFDEQGQPRGAVGAFVDITERRRNEERLRQSQKLESVGLLAGGIAHDFNNLLTGIMGNASMVLDDVDPASAERITEVISSAERAANLTRQLLAYSGKGQFIVRDLDLSEAVNEIAGLVEFSIPKSVELAVNVQRRLPVVRMDPSQLQQILMNLVINAGEAIGEGNPGKITVATSMADIDKPFIDAIGEDVAPGRYVCIAVSDTGSGIAEEEKARIFDPFFTTKFTGRGLGLAAVAGILRSQKGAITLDSARGSGSTFRVFLPVAEKYAPGSEEQPAADERATILVVDDESTVRDFIGAVLRRQKYRVLLASDGREALAVCERETGSIDAAILDVVMPLMGANDLMPALKLQRPKTRILLTSGYSEAEARRLCAAYPGAAFMQKPYTAQQIARAVDELLGVTRP